MATVVTTFEAAKVDQWVACRDRQEDGGRELVLYLRPKLCCKRLGELAAGLKSNGAASTKVRRYEPRLTADAAVRDTLKRVLQLMTCEI